MGIRLVAGSAYSLDVTDFDFTGIDDAEITKFTSTTIKGVAGSFSMTISGKGFEHDSEGYLTDGTVNSVSLTYRGNSILSLSGARVSVEDLIDVLSTYTESDDMRLLKSTLSGDDYMSASKYADLLNGYGGDDKLFGKAGDDRLYGGSGEDVLNGGLGRDRLYGQSGSDTFVFTSKKDSSVGGYDTILDFSRSQHDEIDLSAIDANEKRGGNQSFSFISSNHFHDKAGELRIEHHGKGFMVLGDVNGDGNADFAVMVDGVSGLKASDFDL